MPRKPQGDRALSSAEKMRALRARRAADGLLELRGLYVPADRHDEAKRVLTEWLASVDPVEPATPPES